MISSITTQIQSIAKGLLKSEISSVICINTTHQTYLLFGDNKSFPLFVVSTGSTERIKHLHSVISQLHSVIPKRIAKPIAHKSISFKNSILIQSGLEGRPWFQLSQRIDNSSGWNSLLEKSKNALHDFQTAVLLKPKWSVSINPGNSLRTLISNLEIETLTQEHRNKIDILAKDLDTLGTIQGFYQHGDFCLNNLLFHNSSAAIIDFDEFGLTAMPYHDEFLLANSLFSLSQSRVWNTQSEILSKLIDKKSHIDSDLVIQNLAGFYVCYLIYRISQANRLINRSDLISDLIETLDNFFCFPEKYIPTNL